MLELTPADKSPSYMPRGTKFHSHTLVCAKSTTTDRVESTNELLRLVLALPDAVYQKRVLNEFSITQLTALLTALLRKEDNNNQLKDPNTLEGTAKQLYSTVRDTLNTFPCVKLVDKIVPSANDPYLESMDSEIYVKDPTEENTKRKYDDYFDDDDDELPLADSCKYQICVHSKLYEELVVFLVDHADSGIKFPMADIKTSHLNKIHNFIDASVNSVKISNERLTLLGSSEIVMDKLRVITMSNYENLDVIMNCHCCEKLIIYGNEVDMFTVKGIAEANPRLRRIYYKGRVYRDSEKLVRSPGADDVCDMIYLDSFKPEYITSFGVTRFVGINMYLVEECVFDLTGILQRVKNMHRLGINSALESGNLPICIGKVPSELEHLYLSGCTLDPTSDLSQLSKLTTLTLQDCKVSSETLATLSGNLHLKALSLINTEISWSCVFPLPDNLQWLTFRTSHLEDAKDLLFASYLTANCITGHGVQQNRIVSLDLNSERHNLSIEGPDQLALCKVTGTPLKFPQGMLHLNVVDYPNFGSSDWSVVSSQEFSNLAEVNITLYAYGNTWHKPIHTPQTDKITYNIKYVNMNRWGVENYLPTEGDNSDDDLLAMAYSSDYEEEFEKGLGGRRVGRPRGSHNGGGNRRASRGRAVGSRGGRLGRPRKKREEKNKPIPDELVPVKDGKYLDVNPQDMTEFDTGYQGRKLPFPVAKHTAPPLARPEDPSKPYQCRFCFRSFDRRENFRRHSLIHTDYRPYVCPNCKKGFKRSDNLRSHMRVCHGDGMDNVSAETVTSMANVDVGGTLQPPKRRRRNFNDSFRAFQPVKMAQNQTPIPPSVPEAAAPQILNTPPATTPEVGNLNAGATGRRFQFVTTTNVPPVIPVSNKARRFKGEVEPWKVSVFPTQPPNMATSPPGTGPVRTPPTEGGQDFRNASMEVVSAYVPATQSTSTSNNIPGTPMESDMGQNFPPQELNQPATDDQNPNNVLVFRMDKRSTTPDAKIPNEQWVNDSTSTEKQMNERRKLIRKEINWAFDKCTMDEDGQYICFNCSKRFAKRGNLKRHLMLHLDVNMYSCVCGRTFPRSDNYRTHYSKCKRRKQLGLPDNPDMDPHTGMGRFPQLSAGS